MPYTERTLPQQPVPERREKVRQWLQGYGTGSHLSQKLHIGDGRGGRDAAGTAAGQVGGGIGTADSAVGNASRRKVLTIENMLNPIEGKPLAKEKVQGASPVSERAACIEANRGTGNGRKKRTNLDIGSQHGRSQSGKAMRIDV
ncbi:MAG: hypothetical protein Q9166_003876 [cf. Caloplaca sp. 2 TL-2023]